jgi:hypothetical protein
MRFCQFKHPIKETLSYNISADHLSGMKDLIARRIRSLPDDDATQRALQEIEDMLQHLGKGGRIGAIGKQIDDVKDNAVKDARKILARLVMSIIEETQATTAQRAEFFEIWQNDKIVNIEGLLSHDRIDFAGAFNGYGTNPIMTDFVDEVMSISELGMGRGEFGLNVLSKSISVAGKASKSPNSEEDEGGSKKGDLQIKLNGKVYQVELKTESGGAARFGDQEVRPAEGFEAAAVALNTYVKKHKMYNNLSRKLSGSGMNLNQAIEFHQMVPTADKSKFIGLVQNCLNLIFGNIKGGRKDHLTRLKRNVNDIVSAIQVGDAGGAAQAYSQASFNFYMSRKHDDGVLYTNLNNKTFVFYDDAAQLLDQGLRFHASTPYISATKDPVRSVYPQISVQTTTFGGQAAQAGLKQMSKGKNPLEAPDFNSKMVNWAMTLANRRGVTNQRVITGMATNAMRMIQQKMSSEQIIAELERMYPQLAPKIKQPTKVAAPQPVAPTPPAPAPAPAVPATMQQPAV